MKKLLLFSILFLIFNVAIMNVKAEYCNDGSTIKIMNVFDDELYNDTTKFRGSGLVLSLYKSLYEQSYNDLVTYINSNYKYYFFGSKGVYVWNREDLAVYFLVYNLEENNTNNISLKITTTDPTKELNSNDVKMYFYGDLKSGFDETKNRTDAYNLQDAIYPFGQYTSSEFNTYKAISGCTPPTSTEFYSSGLNTNANVIVAGESYGRDIISNRTERFYKKVQIGDKIYNDGDYLNRVVNHKNPKITFKYLTDTGEEDGHKVGVTTTVDFQTGGIKDNRYSYLISFDGGKVWDALTPRMTSDKYTFVKLENFNVIAKLYDSETGESYYTTGLVDSIENGYYSKWLSYQKNDDYDDYTVVDGTNYLTSITIDFYQDFNRLNGYPLQLYYSYDKNSWREVPKIQSFYLIFNSNKTIYFMYKDVANQSVFYSTYKFSYFDSTESLGEIISFYEEEKMDGEYHVYVYFLNYKDTHSYWVKTVSEDYHEIDVRKMNGQFSWLTTEENTFCAKITQKGEPLKIIQEECYLSGGIRPSPDKSFKKILSDYSESIPNVMNVMSTFFDSLPSGIKNMFVAILLIILAIFIIKLLV